MSNSPSNWRDGRPSIFAADLKFVAKKPGPLGNSAGLVQPLPRTNINTEKVDTAGKTRKLTRALS